MSSSNPKTNTFIVTPDHRSKIRSRQEDAAKTPKGKHLAVYLGVSSSAIPAPPLTLTLSAADKLLSIRITKYLSPKYRLEKQEEDKKKSEPTVVTVVSPSPLKKTAVSLRKSPRVNAKKHNNHTPTKRKKTAVKKKEVSVFLEVDEYVLLRGVIHSASTIYSASRNAPAMTCKLRRRSNELKKLRKDTELVVDKMFNM